MFFPLSADLETFDVASYISRHQPIQSHGEGTGHATAIGAAIPARVAYVVVRSQGDTGVELGKADIMENATGATSPSEVGRTIKLLGRLALEMMRVLVPDAYV